MSVNDVDSAQHLRGARMGLLTTYRRNGEPVATAVSIGVRDGGVFFVTSATSGKARRLAARPDVTVAPSTVRGMVTGPPIQGRARLLSESERRRVRRLLQPGGPLFWSYLLYRIRGHRMLVYDVRFAESGERPAWEVTPTVSTARVYRAVQLTARTSALLFAAVQATSALGPRAGRAPQLLYLAFMAAHAVHFTVVVRYAVVNGGRDLFPGGRTLSDAGGWPTVAGIYTFFSSLAITGWVTGVPRPIGRPALRPIGQAATWLMAAMFVGVYLGQLPRSRWYAVPAAALAAGVTAHTLTQRLRQEPHPRGPRQ